MPAPGAAGEGDVQAEEVAPVAPNLGGPVVPKPPAGWFRATAQHVHKDCKCGPKGGGRNACPARTIPAAIHMNDLIKVNPPNGNNPPPPNPNLNLPGGNNPPDPDAQRIAEQQIADQAVAAYDKKVNTAMKCETSRDRIIDNDGICPTCNLGIKFAKFHRNRPDKESSLSDEGSPKRRRETASAVITSPRTIAAVADDPTSKGTFATGPSSTAETSAQRAWRLLGELQGMMADDVLRTRDAWLVIRAACFAETASLLFRSIRVDNKGKPMSLDTTFSLAEGITPSVMSQLKTVLDSGARAARSILIGYAMRRVKDQPDGGAHRMVVTGYVDGSNKPRSATIYGWLTALGTDATATIGVAGCDIIMEHLLAEVNHPVWWFLSLVFADSDRRVGLYIELIKRAERTHLTTYKDDLQTVAAWNKDRADEKAMRTFTQSLAASASAGRGGQGSHGGQQQQWHGKPQNANGGGRGPRGGQQNGGRGNQNFVWKYDKDEPKDETKDVSGLARDAAAYDLYAKPQNGGARGGGRGQEGRGGGTGRGRGRGRE